MRLVELERPVRPAGRAVLVRMIRAPINPADLLAIDGRYAFTVARDQPLGAEGLGVVDAIGPEVERFSPGDHVLPLSRGNWCRYRLLSQDDLVAVPKGVDPDQAAMMRINPLTALLLLETSGVRAGDTVVQNGAGSNVARWVRFFAARRGIAVVDVVRRFDPDHPLALIDGPDLAAEVVATNLGRPVKAALDCVAGEATGRLAATLGPGGRILVFGHLSGSPISVRSQLMTAGGLTVSGFSLRPAETRLGPIAVQEAFREMFDLLVGSTPIVPVRRTFPLSQIAAALFAARDGGGRTMLDLSA